MNTLLFKLHLYKKINVLRNYYYTQTHLSITIYFSDNNNKKKYKPRKVVNEKKNTIERNAEND